jgi:triacylglycerol lipase
VDVRTDVQTDMPADMPAQVPAQPALTEQAAVAEEVARARWWGAHLREFRWQGELLRLLADPVWRGVGQPRGDGGPVLLIPGFLAGDSSLQVMATWLRRLGHRPHRAGIAMNVHCADAAVDRLEQTLHHLWMRYGREVALVGHSRGGHFAKALGQRCPEQVSQVVSLGSGLDDPFDISEPTRLAVAGARRMLHRDSTRAAQGCFTATCLCRYSNDYRAPFPADVPLTSIYTKGDGVVRWQACVVPYARCVEVRGSHIGLAFNRHAYRELARTLAAPSAP